MSNKRESYHRITAVNVALDIIEAVADAKSGIRPGEIAAVTGIPKPTVMCHLITMAERGYIMKTGETYRLGMKAASLWAKVRAALEAHRDLLNESLKQIGAE